MIMRGIRIIMMLSPAVGMSEPDGRDGWRMLYITETGIRNGGSPADPPSFLQFFDRFMYVNFRLCYFFFPRSVAL